MNKPIGPTTPSTTEAEIPLLMREAAEFVWPVWKQVAEFNHALRTRVYELLKKEWPSGLEE